MRTVLVLIAAVLLFSLAAAEPAVVPGPEKTDGQTKTTAPNGEPSAGQKAPEEAWIFEPPVGRKDIFEDPEDRLVRQKGLLDLKAPGTDDPTPTSTPTGQEAEAILDWAKNEGQRIERLILQRKWEEAIQASDGVLKSLVKFAEHPGVVEVRELIQGYHHQATEAKIYEQAQAEFDALGIKIEGVLWSPEGSLAVISGEARALRKDDKTKDCVIVNIDTNRVDFLFNFAQRRFEFQRYVGEDVKPRSR